MNKYATREDRKSARQTAILEAVSQEEVSTQNDLVRALKKRGIPATQVSISRDIAELGLIKAGGAYKAATAEGGAADPEMPLRTFVRRVVAAGPNLTVVRCDTGAAPRVGLVLDGLNMTGLVGTLAGDDTVFVASDSGAAQKKLVEFLETRMAH
ncbi:MAG: arginine repressor [Elusimicrobia bacterium]|nr:arginine repressor [Elusimicrobiota bacterium]